MLSVPRTSPPPASAPPDSLLGENAAWSREAMAPATDSARQADVERAAPARSRPTRPRSGRRAPRRSPGRCRAPARRPGWSGSAGCRRGGTARRRGRARRAGCRCPRRARTARRGSRSARPPSVIVPPDGEYLIALSTRLPSACRSFSRSPRMIGNSSGKSVSNWCADERGRLRSASVSARSGRSTGPIDIATRPAWIREMSSRSLISRYSRSHSSSMVWAIRMTVSRLQGPSGRASVPAYPLMIETGVWSSWLTIETNDDCIDSRRWRSASVAEASRACWIVVVAWLREDVEDVAVRRPEAGGRAVAEDVDHADQLAGPFEERQRQDLGDPLALRPRGGRPAARPAPPARRSGRACPGSPRPGAGGARRRPPGRGRSSPGSRGSARARRAARWRRRCRAGSATALSTIRPSIELMSVGSGGGSAAGADPESARPGSAGSATAATPSCRSGVCRRHVRRRLQARAARGRSAPTSERRPPLLQRLHLVGARRR